MFQLRLRNTTACASRASLEYRRPLPGRMLGWCALLALFSFAVACKQPESSQDGGQSNFAIVWNWDQSNIARVNQAYKQLSAEFKAQERAGSIGNIYLRNETGPAAAGPSLIYFLKTDSMTTAQRIARDSILFKQQLARHTIYPVGIQWFGRSEKVSLSDAHQVYVVVARTSPSFLAKRRKDTNFGDSVIVEHSQLQLKLWDEGTIENVYFDLRYEEAPGNAVTDFVFFINAPDRAGAESIARGMPFIKAGYATIDVIPAGKPWRRDEQGR